MLGAQSPHKSTRQERHLRALFIFAAKEGADLVLKGEAK